DPKCIGQFFGIECLPAGTRFHRRLPPLSACSARTDIRRDPVYMCRIKSKEVVPGCRTPQSAISVSEAPIFLIILVDELDVIGDFQPVIWRKGQVSFNII